jgi:UDP:flavonoid glycosyltransferase YjiC (YdhE family)
VPAEPANAPEIVQAEVLDDIAVDAAIAGADAVFNLVGILTETTKQTYRAIHVEGVRRVALAAQGHGLNRACARLGVPTLSHTMDLFDRPARVLLAISQAFDFQADSLPTNLRYIGPLLDQPSWSETWRAPWSTNRPRVLIAGSTGAQGQGELIQKIIHAMGQLEIEAVATSGPNLDVNSLQAPSNVHLLCSAPHNTVMQEVSLVTGPGCRAAGWALALAYRTRTDLSHTRTRDRRAW